MPKVMFLKRLLFPVLDINHFFPGFKGITLKISSCSYQKWYKMKNNHNSIPNGISEYIRENFSEDFLTEIKSVKDNKGVEFFYVDVTHEENIFHLKFNSRGELIQKEIESVRFPDDEIEIGNVD